MKSLHLLRIFAALCILVVLCAVTFSGLFQSGPAFTVMGLAVFAAGVYLTVLLEQAVSTARVHVHR